MWSLCTIESTQQVYIEAHKRLHLPVQAGHDHTGVEPEQARAFVRFRDSALHFPVPPHISQDTTPEPKHSLQRGMSPFCAATRPARSPTYNSASPGHCTQLHCKSSRDVSINSHAKDPGMVDVHECQTHFMQHSQTPYTALASMYSGMSQLQHHSKS